MSLMQNELNRAIKYAEGLGVKVAFKPYKKGCPDADWATDGSEINLYVSKRDSITSTILSLIHELAHHMSFVYEGRKQNVALDSALGTLENLPKGEVLSKSKRKIIYDMEKHDSQYQLVIYKELNLNIPEWKVILQRELGNWAYRYYYINGVDAKRKQVKEKYKQLLTKYRSK